ncbi:MAG: ABC transporter permease [Gemmataceae bacterium]
MYALIYAINTLWHERNRYLPGILAVTFSAILIALQCGLLVGLLTLMSLVVDNTPADIWVGYPHVPSVDQGRPIPDAWGARIAQFPSVTRLEPTHHGFANWNYRDPNDPRNNKVDVGMIVGSRLDEGALGAVQQLTPEMRLLLSEPFTIVVDRSELDRLGLRRGGIGEYAEVNGYRVRVVGLVDGLKGLGAPYLFCSLDTARILMQYREDTTTYWLAQCRTPQEAEYVVQQLNQYPHLAAFTRNRFSWRSRWHWLVVTKAGVALGMAALLGLIVGSVVTSQTLYAATAASIREFATMRALGIPRPKLRGMVLAVSFWVGIFGVGLALPLIFLVATTANTYLGTRIELSWWLLLGTAIVTMTMALISGLASLRSLSGAGLTEPLR